VGRILGRLVEPQLRLGRWPLLEFEALLQFQPFLERLAPQLLQRPLRRTTRRRRTVLERTNPILTVVNNKATRRRDNG
jgi:hypothetical protein